MANAELERATSEIVDALQKIARRGDYPEDTLTDAVIGAAAAFVSHKHGTREAVVALLHMATGLLQKPDRLS
jgi:hypothetical protein